MFRYVALIEPIVGDTYALALVVGLTGFGTILLVLATVPVNVRLGNDGLLVDSCCAVGRTPPRNGNDAKGGHQQSGGCKQQSQRLDDAGDDSEHPPEVTAGESDEVADLNSVGVELQTVRRKGGPNGEHHLAADAGAASATAAEADKEQDEHDERAAHEERKARQEGAEDTPNA